MNRRTFLKASAAAAVVSSVPLYFNFKDYSKVLSEEPVKIVPNICKGCTNYCGMFVHVKNDRVWKVEGNPIHLKSGGHLCARGHGMAADIYGKGRIQGPLKRVGDNEFEPITWEQAFKEIGAKLKDIVKKYGGNTVMWMEHGTHRQFYVNQLFNQIGSSNFTTQYSTCFNSKTNAWQNMIGGMPGSDFLNAKYIIFQGRNFAGGIVPEGMNRITKAKENGAKIIVIDPRYSEIAKIAHEWIPIRPGTDLAFRLAMANVIIQEGLYNKPFVNDFVEGFEEFKQLNKEYTPEWAEKITDIKAEKIREIARDFAKNAPNALLDSGWHGLHAHYVNSTEIAQMAVIINSLIGNFMQPGGLFAGASIPLGEVELPKRYQAEKGPRADGAGVEGSEYFTVEASRGIAHITPQLIEEGKIKAVFIYNYNPVRTAPNPEYQKKIKNADLVVTIPTYFDDTSYYTAHYILPEHYYLERMDHPETVSGVISHPSPQIAMRFPAVKPMYDTKHALDILKGITEAMGYKDLYPFTVEEEAKAVLKPTGVTIEKLREVGTVEFPPVIKPGYPMMKGKPAFPSVNGKVNFSMDILRLNGFSGYPTWVPPLVMPDPNKPEEFRLIHGKQPWHSHAQTSNNAYLLAMSKRYRGTWMWINKKRADALGIKDGDTVIIENEQASKKVQAHVTELLHPECVWIPSAYGVQSKKLTDGYNVGINWNDFLPVMVEPKSGGTNSQEVIVRIRKEGR